MAIRNISTKVMVIIIAISLAIVIYLCWLIKFYQHQQLAAHSDNNNVPDTVIANVHFTQNDASGQVRSQFFSPKAIYHAKKDITEFNQPQFTLYDKDGLPWKITAQHGKSMHAATTIILWGDVKVVKVTAESQDNLEITTNSLVTYPRRQFAQTHDKVIIKQGNSSMEAIGMEVNLQTDSAKLLSQVRGTYVPTNK